MLLGLRKGLFVFQIALFATLFPASSASASAARCVDIFGKSEQPILSEDPFTFSDRIEKNLNALINEISLRYGEDPGAHSRLNLLLEKTNEELKALARLQEKLVNEEPVSVHEFALIHSRTVEIRKSLNNALERVTRNHPAPGENSALRDLNELIEDPSKAIAEEAYRVQLISGERLSVILSKEIVKEVFSNPSMSRYAARSLKKLQKGIFGWSYGGEGIIRLGYDASVVEIRMIGKDGNFRLFGYLENGNLHLVDYITTSDHSAELTMKIARRVLGIKKTRGH